MLGKLMIIFAMYLGKHRGLPGRDDDVIDFKFKQLKKAYHYQEGTDLQLSDVPVSTIAAGTKSVQRDESKRIVRMDDENRDLIL